jgi:hypothetical protein
MQECADAILTEPGVDFYYSPLVRLEVMLQPTHLRRIKEISFYENIFKTAKIYGNLNHMFEIAEREALAHGITVIDAFHLAAATLSRCELFITTEKSSKPLFRSSVVKSVSLLSLRSADDARRLVTPP